jgi:Lhr-like helicase
MPGDIFQLGNTAYRILKVETGKVRVEDAHGQPPTMPFWFGEAPGRSDELSTAVSRLRENIDAKLKDGIEATVAWLLNEFSDVESSFPRRRESSEQSLPSGQSLIELDSGVRQNDGVGHLRVRELGFAGQN